MTRTQLEAAIGEIRRRYGEEALHWQVADPRVRKVKKELAKAGAVVYNNDKARGGEENGGR